MDSVLEVLAWITSPVRWVAVLVLGETAGTLVGVLLSIAVGLALVRLAYEAAIWITGYVLGLAVYGVVFALRYAFALLGVLLGEAWQRATGRPSGPEPPPFEQTREEWRAFEDTARTMEGGGEAHGDPPHPLEARLLDDPWWAVLRDDSRPVSGRKAAYRQLCKAYHPDKVGGDRAAQDAAKRCFQTFNAYWRRVEAAHVRG